MEAREAKLGITADRFEDHHGYYLQLAHAVGIGWADDEPEFMNHDLAYWKRLYSEDKNLNNHPLRLFDKLYPSHMVYVAPKAGSWSMCDTVCCLKAVIREKIFQDERSEGLRP
jgi:hypothetical protein